MATSGVGTIRLKAVSGDRMKEELLRNLASASLTSKLNNSITEA